jgi:hypothetical protein
VAIRLNVDLSDKVSAVLELGKERVDSGAIDEFSGSSSENIVLREMHVNIGEFLTPGLKMQVGITTWSFDVRGKGSSFAFDPRHSQSFTRNAGATQDTGASWAAKGSAPEELDPVGATFRYQRDALQFDFVFLPMVIEGGNPSDDEAFYALDFLYNLDNMGSRVGAILALTAIPGDDTSIFTFGIGATIGSLSKGLELFAEVYFQFGNAGQDTAGDSFDAGGMAFQVGAQYAFQANNKPWVALSLTLISGDDDTSSTDDSVDRFMSYENINDLIILEDMYFGFDVDSNYFAIKISGGVTLSVGRAKDNLELSLILGITKLNEDVLTTSGGEDKLGNEVDIKARWILTKQASLNGAIGLLLGSDVLEAAMGGSANSDSDDSAMLYTFGMDLIF